MRVTLALELDEKAIEKETGKPVSPEDARAVLTDMLFEVCEDWVLRGDQPDFEFTEK